jgi:hypothetical protein
VRLGRLNVAKYAIRLPASRVLQERIAYLLTRPVGRPPNEVRRYHANFTYQAGSWTKPRRVIAKVEWHPGEPYPRVGFIVTNMSRATANVVLALMKKCWRPIDFLSAKHHICFDVAVRRSSTPKIRKRHGSHPRQSPGYAGASYLLRCIWPRGRPADVIGNAIMVADRRDHGRFPNPGERGQGSSRCGTWWKGRQGAGGRHVGKAAEGNRRTGGACTVGRRLILSHHT